MFRGFLGSFLDNMMRPNKSNIDQLLENKDCTLEELMADNDILTECKWGNQKVVSYFDRAKVSQLLDYIIQMPPEDATHERGHKFPFLASEIFNCELNKVNDAFFTLPEPEPIREEPEQNPFDKDGNDDFGQKNESEDEEEMQTASPEKQQEAKDEDEDDFERCNEEPDDIIELGDDGQFTLGKIEEQTSKKSRSKRYEENDELDMNIIDLGMEQNSHTLQEMVTAAASIEPEEGKEEGEAKNPKENEDNEEEEKEIEVIEPEKEDEEEKEGVLQEAKEEKEEKEEKDGKEVKEDNEEKEEMIELEEKYDVETDEIDLDLDAKEEEIVELDGAQEEAKAEIKAEEDDEKQEKQEMGLLDLQNSQDAATASTAPTQQEQPISQNKYELFEKFLSFLETDEELNPVLCGYFCKLFQVLVGNKPREVYSYIYNNPNVLDLIVKHIYNKSISDILIRLLNVSESVFDEGFERVDSIRQSFVFKVIERLDPQYSGDDHLNAQGLLSELLEYKSIYSELTSQRCCAKYKAYLDSDCQSSRVNTYMLLKSMVGRFNQNEGFQKKMNLGSFEDGAMEDMLQYDDQKDSELLTLIEAVVIENVQADLDVKPEDNLNPDYETTYGFSQKPFGLVRTRCVEFLAQAFTIFPKELHPVLLDKGIYDDLLHFIELYPFHNILHAKVGEVLITLMEKQVEETVSLLEQTHLLKKILDLSREGQFQKFESERHMVKGYIAYVRKVANKIVEIQKDHEEVNNFLEAIPEWKEFVEGELKIGNDVESKPLASDPRKKNSPAPDEDFEFFFKMKSHGFKSNDQDEAENEEDEEKNEIDLDDDDNRQFDIENIFPKSTHPPLRLLSNDDDDSDIRKYFSNGEGEKQEDQDQPAPLSLEELISSSSQQEDIPLNPTFDGNQYWKLEDAFDLDQLLEDYN